MEFVEGVVVSRSRVPAFLTKLKTLVEDTETDPLICWSPNGTSFHVFDQGRFSKEVLPKFFKHNNMASFVRQLNIYGFHKVVHEHGVLVKQELDDTEFQHPSFIRGRDQLLKNIKRKVTNVSNLKQDELKVFPEEVSKILSDVQLMKGKQENILAYCISIKHENEALRREIASLKLKLKDSQSQQQKVLGMKRKIPLMLNDSTSAHSMPKYSQQYSLEPLQSSQAISASSGGFSAASLCPADSPLNSGSIDYGLENLPYIQSINFDSSPLCEFSALFPVETDLDSPDILLSPEPAKGTDGGNYSSNTRKQLVTTEPMCLGQADLPSLLGQEVDSYFTLVNM